MVGYSTDLTGKSWITGQIAGQVLIGNQSVRDGRKGGTHAKQQCAIGLVGGGRDEFPEGNGLVGTDQYRHQCTNAKDELKRDQDQNGMPQIPHDRKISSFHASQSSEDRQQQYDHREAEVSMHGPGKVFFQSMRMTVLSNHFGVLLKDADD